MHKVKDSNLYLNIFNEMEENIKEYTLTTSCAIVF